MSHLHPIPADQIDGVVWAYVEPLVARCFKKINEYRWAPEDVLFYLQERDMQLWIAADDERNYGIVITQILITPRARECFIFMICGEFPADWRSIQSEIEHWAKDMQCTHVSAMSRPGSARINGYTKGMIHTYKEL